MAIRAQSVVVKNAIENTLASRIPAALSPIAAQAPRLLSVGVSAIDDLLGGGLPIGGISEFTGAPSSGRTCLAYCMLREASQESACAYIDVSHTLDPISAASSGVTLSNLLWVRLAVAAEEPATVIKPKQQASYLGQSVQKHSYARGFGAHPRTETKGMSRALEKILRDKAEARMKKKAEGTPGYPNQKLSVVAASLSAANKDQIDYEHFNARHADVSDPRRQSDQLAAQAARECARAQIPLTMQKREPEKHWSRLDKALQATDQILQSGGFRVVVLDLASVLPEHALRIPLATWFRFRRAAQQSDAILLLLTQQACARSSAACVIECSSDSVQGVESNVFSAAFHSVEITRQRITSAFSKKAPGRVTTWTSTAHWMRAVGK